MSNFTFPIKQDNDCIIFFSDVYRVVGFHVDAKSVHIDDLKFEGKRCSFPSKPKPQLVDPMSGTKLYFTYEVEWEVSKISWASRWDTYLAMSDAQIHWFSIINSIVVIFFLSGKKNMKIKIGSCM